MGSGLQRLATRWKHAVGWTSNSTQLEWRQQEGAIFKEYQSCASVSKDIETAVFRNPYGAWQRMLEHMNSMCFFRQTMGVYCTGMSPTSATELQSTVGVVFTKACFFSR